jgi:hypothetical protein
MCVLNMPIQPIDQLPNQPISIETIYELMTPPRKGVGYVEPAFSTHALFEDQCVGFCAEIRGEYYGIYLHQDDGWVVMDLVLDDINEIFSDAVVDEAFLRELEDTVSKVRHDNVVRAPESVWLEAPVGVVSKLEIPHHPLTIEDLGMLEANGIFTNLNPLYGSNSKIIAICGEEKSINPTEDSEFIFMYYHPEYETWRVVDVLSDGLTSDLADQLHKDTKSYVSEHYDEYELIFGPPSLAESDETGSNPDDPDESTASTSK